MDEVVLGRAAVDLVSQAAHVDVDSAVAVTGAPPPDLLQQLIAGGDAPRVEGQRIEEAELGRCELCVDTVHVRLHLAGVDAELLDLDRLASVDILRTHPSPGGCLHTGDELLHRERLHEIVVGPELERVDAVMLGPAGADDDDRRTDPFGSRGLDHAPAVPSGQHEVEHAHVGVLVAKSCEAEIALRDQERLEARGAEVLGHRLADHLVVLDDEDRSHRQVNNGVRVAGPVEDTAPDPYEELRTGFTAVVSHELRTPLARALALLESGSDPATVLHQVRAEIELMSELVDDVLFLAELESGRVVVAFGQTKALPELERVAAEYQERSDRANVTIELTGDPDAEVPLRARMLHVVAENLIENALRYAGPGSTLRLGVEQDEGAATLVAADDGPGVPEEDLHRVFERFYRGDRARASRGTGLGLAVVKHVVTSAGGTVEAAGRKPRGLEIRCRFPV
jgi:signal transduction histidine kinase